MLSVVDFPNTGLISALLGCDALGALSAITPPLDDLGWLLVASVPTIGLYTKASSCVFQKGLYLPSSVLFVKLKGKTPFSGYEMKKGLFDIEVREWILREA